MITYNFQILYDKPLEYKRKSHKPKSAIQMLFVHLSLIHFDGRVSNPPSKVPFLNRNPSFLQIFFKFSKLNLYLDRVFYFWIKFKIAKAKKRGHCNDMDSSKFFSYLLTQQNYHMYSTHFGPWLTSEVIEGYIWTWRSWHFSTHDSCDMRVTHFRKILHVKWVKLMCTGSIMKCPKTHVKDIFFT